MFINLQFIILWPDFGFSSLINSWINTWFPCNTCFCWLRIEVDCRIGLSNRRVYPLTIRLSIRIHFTIIFILFGIEISLETVGNISSLFIPIYSIKIIFLWSRSCSRDDCHLYQMNQTLPEVMTIKTTIIIISFCLRASLSALFFSILASTSSSYVSLITPKSRFSSVVHHQKFYGIINKYLVTNLVMRRRINQGPELSELRTWVIILAPIERIH